MKSSRTVARVSGSNPDAGDRDNPWNDGNINQLTAREDFNKNSSLSVKEENAFETREYERMDLYLYSPIRLHGEMRN
jgi:hypothetical protein